MSDETDDEEIHVASDDAPVLTKYEPDFRRVFARGTLLRQSESDNNTVQLGFWSNKDTGIEMEDGAEAIGYQLETEVMMHWDSVLRLRNLLDNYMEDHAPDHLDE